MFHADMGRFDGEPYSNNCDFSYFSYSLNSDRTPIQVNEQLINHRRTHQIGELDKLLTEPCSSGGVDFWERAQVALSAPQLRERPREHAAH